MKAGTQNHLKVKRLRRLLGVPLYRAVGILETMWLLCADCCDEGNIGKFSDEEIADYLEWDGSASELVRALADSGWIDPDNDRRLVVHDWLEHCPEYIRDRVRKRHARHTKKEIRQSNPNKIKTYGRLEPDNGGQVRTNTGPAAACPVYSKPNQSQPIQSQPIQSQPNKGAAVAAIEASPIEVDSPQPPHPEDAPPAKEPPAPPKEPRAEDYPVPSELETPLFRAALRDWFAQRRRRRLSLRPEYLKRQFARLLPLGQADAAACLRNTIDQDYDGIFPEKFAHGRNHNGTQKLRPGSRPVAAGERGL